MLYARFDYDFKDQMTDIQRTTSVRGSSCTVSYKKAVSYKNAVIYKHAVSVIVKR